jgi:hypothetical protein
VRPDEGPGSGDDVGQTGGNENPDRVLVVRTLGAPRRHLIRGRRTRQAAAEPAPSPLPLTRVTVISSGAFESRGEARRWLERTTGDADALEAEVDRGIALLNRALHVQRAGAADPLVGEVGERDASAIRVGYGSGNDLVEGRFAEAREIPRRPPRRRRAEMLRPQERIAAVLGGRHEVDVCETLVLRARLDLDNGRAREAALQIRVGLEALIAELGEGRAGAGQADDMAILDAARGGIGRAANTALNGELDEGQLLDVNEAIEVSERVLRRRRLLSE